jgi:hypothetical protein
LNIFGQTETRHNLFTSLSQKQAQEHMPKSDTIKKIKATLRVGMVINRTDNGENYTITVLNPTKFEVRNAKGSGFKAPYLWKGFTIVGEPSAAQKKVQTPADIKATLRVGQTIKIKQEEYTILKLNPTKFRVQHTVSGKIMEVPYLWYSKAS